jgi:glycosyltransferase involved in cell wall biosynthesis
LYVEQCLEGFVNQTTNFIFEILIHDDASTDLTQEIIEMYHLKYPKLIYPILQKTNQFQQGKNNWIEYQFPRAKSKYIALCEGDDFWTDPYKLQKQVDFLESNPDFSFCWHPVEVEGEPFEFPEGPEELSFEQMLENHYIPTCSLVFRRECLKDLPGWVSRVHSADIAIELFLASKGNGKRINCKMGVYRRHAGGISQTTNHQHKWKIDRITIYSHLLSSVPKRYHKALKSRIYQISKEALELKDHPYSFSERFKFIVHLIRTTPITSKDLHCSIQIVVSKFISLIKFHLLGLIRSN